jgi:hypothetical protein
VTEVAEVWKGNSMLELFKAVMVDKERGVEYTAALFLQNNVLAGA